MRYTHKHQNVPANRYYIDTPSAKQKGPNMTQSSRTTGRLFTVSIKLWIAAVITLMVVTNLPTEAFACEDCESSGKCGNCELLGKLEGKDPLGTHDIAAGGMTCKKDDNDTDVVFTGLGVTACYLNGGSSASPTKKDSEGKTYTFPGKLSYTSDSVWKMRVLGYTITKASPVRIYGPGGELIQEFSEDNSTINVGQSQWLQDFDEDGRLIRLRIVRAGTLQGIAYVKYTEVSGELARKRVTEIRFNSDDTPRVQNTVYSYYYDDDEAPEYKKEKYVVQAEGVCRYLIANPTKSGVSVTNLPGIGTDDPDDDGPLQACDLDDTTSVTDAALDDYASTIYHSYDSEGRITKMAGSGCGGCGGGGSIQTTYYWYEDNASHTPGDANSWETRKGTCLVWDHDSDEETPDVPTNDPATIEYYNEWGQVIYSIKQTMSSYDVVDVWITHNKYDKNETNYGDDTPRLIETRYPSACTGYTDGAYEATIGTITYEWATITTVVNDGSVGLVRLYEYYTSDSTTDYDGLDAGVVADYDNVKVGGFKGELYLEKVRKGTGSGGTTHYVRKYTYLQVDYDDFKACNEYQTTEYADYVTSDTGGDTTTTDYVFFADSGSATHAVEERTVTYPIVTPANNGSNSATSVTQHYKQIVEEIEEVDVIVHYYNDWTKHEDGRISYREEDADGELVKTIEDVDTDIVADFDDLPAGWSSPDGMHVVRTNPYTYDDYGRVETYTDSAGIKTKYAYTSTYDADRNAGTTTRLVTLTTPHIDGDDDYDYLPVSISVTDMDGRAIISAQGVATSNEDGNLANDWTKAWYEGTTFIEDAFSGTLTSRTDYVYDDADFNGVTDANNKGKLTETRRYHDIPAQSPGTLITNYYRTKYGYDPETGRQWYTKSETGLITFTQVDALGRTAAIWKGGALGDAPTNEDPNNTYGALWKVSVVNYDESTPGSGTSGVGDGLATSSFSYFGGSANQYHKSINHYDYRGRMRGSETQSYDGTSAWAVVGPVNVVDLDNMGRTTARAQYSSTSSFTTTDPWDNILDDPDFAENGTATNRLALSTTDYDEKGQVWKQTVHEITQSTGATTANSMATNYWYDPVGRQIKTEQPTGMFSKTQYDGLGRAVAQFESYDDSESDSPTYNEADDADDDTVISASWTEYDDDRAVSQWAGTKLGTTPIASNPNAGTTAGDMVRISQTWYDSTWNTSGTDLPYATGMSTLKPGVTAAPASDDITTDHDSYYTCVKYAYDSAGRTSQVTSPDPSSGDGNYVEYTYDDLGRTLTVQTKNSSNTLLAKFENVYNGAGGAAGPTSRKVYEVSAGTSYLETTYDYDIFGRPWMITHPSGAVTKIRYDEYGRVVGQYLCSDVGSSIPWWVTTDTVVSQTIPSYDDTKGGRVWLMTNYERNDGGSGDGALTASNARATYSVTWFDDAGRTEYVASYGTNGGDAITESSYSTADTDFDGDGSDETYASAQSGMQTGTSTMILAKYEYDGYGRTYKVTDNAGCVTSTFWDDDGRVTHVAENYDNFDPDNETTTSGDASDHSKDRVTKFTYVGPTMLVKEQIALDPSGDGTTTANEDQVTRYIYQAELSVVGCYVPNGARLRAIMYPDSINDAFTGTPASPGTLDTTNKDHVTLSYHTNGGLLVRTDQRGTLHYYEYDRLGRRTTDRVLVPGTGVDSTIGSISYTYDDLGRREKVTSHTDTSPDMDDWTDVANQVVFAYDEWGNMDKSWQSHAGAADTDPEGGESPNVQYAYEAVAGQDEAVTTDKVVRLQKITYPNGREVFYNYPSSGIGLVLSQLDNIAAAASPTDSQKYAAYTYLGAGTIVKVAHPGVSNGLDLTYKGSTAGTYDGFDRFGRVIDQKWQDTQGTPVVKDRFRYGYDASSNRTWREVAYEIASRPTTLDEFYTYDGLNRLKNMDRGALAGTHPAYTGITGPAAIERDWTLSQTGNWSGYVEKAAGSETLAQARTHNAANEIWNSTPADAITETTGSSWLSPVYDAAGNMTYIPRPGDEATAGEALVSVYDAWNRPAKVYKDDGATSGQYDANDTLIAEYQYNGQHRRIVKLLPNGENWKRTDYYYNAAWQCLEERYNGNVAGKTTAATVVKTQYLWDIRYIDAAVLRWHDGNDDDDFADANEVLYYTGDANMNVTALVNTSGAAVERYVYDPYGAVSIFNGSWTPDGDGLSNYDNEILYCGYRRDPETNLDQVRNRYRHLHFGWITPDQLNQNEVGGGYHDGMNLYQYCLSSPLMRLDTYGLATFTLTRELWDRDYFYDGLKFNGSFWIWNWTATRDELAMKFVWRAKVSCNSKGELHLPTRIKRIPGKGDPKLKTFSMMIPVPGENLSSGEILFIARGSYKESALMTNVNGALLAALHGGVPFTRNRIIEGAGKVASAAALGASMMKDGLEGAAPGPGSGIVAGLNALDSLIQTMGSKNALFIRSERFVCECDKKTGKYMVRHALVKEIARDYGELYWEEKSKTLWKGGDAINPDK